MREDGVSPEAAESGEERLTIQRLFASPDLSGPSARSVRFSPDGRLVTFLRPKAEDLTVLDLWAVPAEGGEPFRLVDAAALESADRVLSEAEIQYRERARISAGGIVSYDWDQTGEAILAPAAGDLFLIDPDTGEARRLTETEAAETDAKVSPDGRFVSFVRDQDLWLHDLESGETRALTETGEGPVSWGVAEFVAQEEMSRFTGYWWSPEGTRIAATRIDESPVEIVERLEIDADGLTAREQRYPRAGTDNVAIELHVIDVESGARTEIDLGPEADIYLARVDWSLDGATLYVQRQNRAQTELDLLAADPDTGAAAVMLSERADTWINLTDDFTPLSDGGFLWTSERTGFRHVYRVSPDGETRQITSGEWVVDEISAVDEAAGSIWFEGWMETPLERHLYRVDLEGADAPVRVTSGEGWWTATVAPRAGAFIGGYSDPATPPSTGLYGLDGERRAWILENALDADHPYAPYADGHLTPRFETITAADGETGLNAMIYRPEGCTAESPCPALIDVYGGPRVQRVRKAWMSPTDQVWARNGYVLFRVDNRGTWNRGHRFEAWIHDRMGTVEVADQIAGLDHLASLDFVDPERVGLRGWSYGGYMTLMTTLTRPGRFAAGMAGAPVTDWARYDTHYTERYMGRPQDNPEGYEEGAPLSHVAGYETPLLVVHGMSDDNVLFDNTTSLILALQEEGAVFDLMTYPGQRHGVRPPALRTHLMRTEAAFFAEHLDGEALP